MAVNKNGSVCVRFVTHSNIDINQIVTHHDVLHANDERFVPYTAY